MKNKYVTECLLYATYMVFGISWAAAGGLMPQIRQALGIGLAESSFITTSVTIAKIIGALGVVWLLSKLGLKKSFIVGSLLISVSVFSGVAHDYYTLLIIRFLMGLGGAICLVCLVPVVQGLFEQRQWTMVNGINGTSNVVGTIIALSSSTIMLAWFSWKEILSFWGAVSLVLLVLWILFAKDIDGRTSGPSASNLAASNQQVSYLDALKSRYTWGMVLFYIFVINYLITSFTYFPTYFQQYLHFGEHDLAAYAPTLINVGLLVGCLTGPKVLARFSNLNMVLGSAVVLCVVSGVASLMVASQVAIVILAALSGYIVGTILPSFLSLPTTMKNTNVQLTGYIMSIFWFCTFTISTFNTWVMGFLADQFGGFGYSFAYMFLLAVLSFVGVMVLPAARKQ